MRVGVFGGTFDPVHMGHLILAEQCREQAGLDQVRFVPAARPPHKQDAAVSPFADRLEMLRLAAAGNPAFVIDELEGARPGPSFTVDTLAALAAQHPGARFELILGADCLADLPGWREPLRILKLAGLLIVDRPGFPRVSADSLRASLEIQADFPLRIVPVHSPLIDISSNALRDRVASGRSIRYWTPRAVECYIEAHKLYRRS